MKKNNGNAIFSAERAGSLETPLRRLFQNPKRILRRYITPGMTVLDFGCGPGFFTIEMAGITGPAGKVIAADMQQEMLEIVNNKIKKYNLGNIVEVWKCTERSTGLSGKFDFILIFHVLHELPDQAGFLKEVQTLLNQDGRILLVEPQFHVSGKEFEELEGELRKMRFEITAKPGIFLSRSMLLKKKN
ncbi:MAG: methyltransferase domain-containing protein [Bacteroidota bacterium]